MHTLDTDSRKGKIVAISLSQHDPEPQFLERALGCLQWNSCPGGVSAPLLLSPVKQGRKKMISFVPALMPVIHAGYLLLI